MSPAVHLPPHHTLDGPTIELCTCCWVQALRQLFLKIGGSGEWLAGDGLTGTILATIEDYLSEYLTYLQPTFSARCVDLLPLPLSQCLGGVSTDAGALAWLRPRAEPLPQLRTIVYRQFCCIELH